MDNAIALRRSPLGVFPGQPTPRLYDHVVEVLRARHYSRRTEEACLHWIRRFHLRVGLGRAPLPDALARKYPNADREWVWQWVFPASSHYLDPLLSG